MAKRKDSRSATDNTATLKAPAATPELTIMAPSEPVTLSDAPSLTPHVSPSVDTTVPEMIGPLMPDGYKKSPAVETLSKIAAELSAAPKMPVGPNVPLLPKAPVAEAPTVSASQPWLRIAATVAIAAGIGALLGAGGVSAYGRMTAAPVVYTVEANPSKTAKLEADIAALKATIEASAKTTSGQVGKLAERLERAEKAQPEAAAKVTKLSDKINEALERFDQRLAAASAPETTGSINPSQSRSLSVAAAADPKQDKLQDKVQTTAAQPVIAGWVLRDIFDGRALVESQFGMYEVGPGGNLPGIGRVASIKRQDGRWVVVTPKGVIVSQR